MKTVKSIFAYLLKHWRWSLLGVCLVLFVLLSGHTFGAVLKGMSAMGFIWVASSIVKFYGEPALKAL